jgi:uncharacterized protein (TIGR03437 family)
MTCRTRAHCVVLAAALFLFAPVRLFAITAAQWQADLQTLVTFLESTHPNLFFHVSAQDFSTAVNDLTQSIPQLSDDQITVRIMQLVAMVGDAHTVAYSPLFADLPIRFRWFSDGLFVNAAVPEYSQALGAKVMQIGNLPVDQAYGLVSTVIPHDNDYWVRETTETYLGTSRLLAALGITSGPDSASYVLQDMSGAQFEIQVSPSFADLLWPPDSTNGFVPLWRWNYNLNYWYQYLPTTQTIYLAYNRCEEMAGLSFADFLTQVLAFTQQQPVNHIVVDLRNNTGGDSQVFQPFLDLLADNAALRGKVTAIIGQATFSSGVMNAAALSYQFGIPLIGGPTGGNPSSYGNIVEITLPNSGMVASCSTEFFICYPGYVGNSLLPDVLVSYSSADYFARYDPYLAAALAQPVRFSNPEPGASAGTAVNAATFGSPISAGEWATVFGDFSGAATAAAASLPLETNLGGVQVQLNGVPAPLLAVSPSQINFQVPSVTGTGNAQIAINVPGQGIVAQSGQVVASSPGIFLMDFFSLDRPGAVLSEANQLTSSTVRANRNEVIQIFATGAGPLTQPIADGVPAPTLPLVQTILAPRVFIGNEEATVEFSGLAPGYVGLWQINALIPDVDTITGQVPVVIIGPEGYASNAVTIWVE